MLEKLNVCAENMRDEKRGSVTHKGTRAMIFTVLYFHKFGTLRSEGFL